MIPYVNKKKNQMRTYPKIIPEMPDNFEKKTSEDPKVMTNYEKGSLGGDCEAMRSHSGPNSRQVVYLLWANSPPHLFCRHRVRTFG